MLYIENKKQQFFAKFKKIGPASIIGVQTKRNSAACIIGRAIGRALVVRGIVDKNSC